MLYVTEWGLSGTHLLGGAMSYNGIGLIISESPAHSDGHDSVLYAWDAKTLECPTTQEE